MKIYNYDCAVIGTGAEGYNAACRLKMFGKNTVIVTEGINCGTSRNTGSDKQTYYKLGLGGDSPDSVAKMAENLFSGGCVDGDNALCEAALSARCFMNLCELGVPFPHNRYGEFVGYKTDHDPYARATSAGPLTSKFMTEALEDQAAKLGVDILDRFLAIEILKYDNRVIGLLCLEISNGELSVIKCSDIVICTGGPAGIYADSVYPSCHTGSTALALLAGAKAQNLTEWQYGLASVSPRWNVSGTYMQVLPRFVSVDSDGAEHEFLMDFFKNPYEALSMVFLKGYQWPFDSRKVLDGSSVIDLLVYRESVIRKRRVYLDYTRNPFDLDVIDFGGLAPEAYDYLSHADACFGTPIERLYKMNSPAIELYRGKGVDISKEYLEIALSAQHNNGGISVDMWWQTCIRGLFAAGECAGTHGITRPGGSALNAGQVGSLRAAQYISEHPNAPVSDKVFFEVCEKAVSEHRSIINRVSSVPDNIDLLIKKVQRRMSDNAAAIRVRDSMKSALDLNILDMESLNRTAGTGSISSVYKYYKLKDILVTSTAVLTSMIDYADNQPSTRGSALYYTPNGTLRDGLEESFRFTPESEYSGNYIRETSLGDKGFVCMSRKVRPIPDGDDFFENVWRSFRENKNIY